MSASHLQREVLVCVCMCTFIMSMCVCVCTCFDTLGGSFVYMRVCSYVYTGFVCVCMCVYICVCVCMCVYIRVCVCVCVCVPALTPWGGSFVYLMLICSRLMGKDVCSSVVIHNLPNWRLNISVMFFKYCFNTLTLIYYIYKYRMTVL